MPTDLAVWPAESGQAAYCTAVATDAWLAREPETARRFLAALARAETFVAENPAAARAIVEKRLHHDSAYMDAVWPEHRFALSLDQSLVAAMEDEARWKIANNMTNATAIPDFRDYIDTTALGQVRPEAVRVL
jgi:NitT/TauT family transport system substrate-binding protein